MGETFFAQRFVSREGCRYRGADRSNPTPLKRWATRRHRRDGASVGWLRSKWPVLRLALVFGLLIGAFYACYAPLTQTDLFDLYLAGLANVSGGILRLLGHEVAVSGLLVSSPTFSFTIVQGCDGLEMAAFFGVAVLASPVALR